ETLEPFRLYLQSSDPIARAQTAEALATKLGLRLLVTDVGHATAAGFDLGQLVPRLLREAWFRAAVVFLDGLDHLAPEATRASRDALLSAAADEGGHLLLGGSGRWPLAGSSLPKNLRILAA